MSNAALHILYRPKTITDIVGQPYVVQALTNAITHNRIMPAYLFSGVRGTGKTSAARAFAKSLNCQASPVPTIEPCGKCQSCLSIARGESLDVMEMDGGSTNSVNDAKDLVEKAPLSPMFGRYRVFIIDECHQLTTNALNALLKTVEEPPAHCVFIFCTTERHKLLATIVSRCQRYDFQRLSNTVIAEQLRYVADDQSIPIEDEALHVIARLSQGGMRDALTTLSQVRELAVDGATVSATDILEMSGAITETSLMAIMQGVVNGNVAQLLLTARELVGSGRSPQLLVSTLAQVYRDLLIIKTDRTQSALTESPLSAKRLQQLAERLSHSAIYKGISQLQEAEQQMRFSNNDGTWVETTLLSLISTVGIDILATADNGAALPILDTALSNGRPKHSTAATATATAVDVKAVWQSVLEGAKPNAKQLLQQAKLRSLDEGTATIAAPRALLDRLRTNSAAIARMVKRAAELNAEPELKFVALKER